MKGFNWLGGYLGILFWLTLPEKGRAEEGVNNSILELAQTSASVSLEWGIIILLIIAVIILFWQNRLLRKKSHTQAQTEEALIKSQFLLEEAQQMAHVGNWELDPTSMKAYWSEEIFRIFDMPMKDDVGPECLATILHPEDRDGVIQSIKNAAINQSTHHMEYRIIRPNGEERWIDCRAEAILDENQQVLKLRGVVKDITQHKMNELQLKEREQQVRDLLEFTAEAIFGLDINGDCTFANPACVKMLGYKSAEQLVGQNMHQLIHYAKNDGSHYQEQDCPIYHAFLSNQGVHVNDEVFWQADGTPINVEYWSYPINREEQVTGAVVAFMDITERLKVEEAIHDSEERYRTIFDGAPEGVWIIGPNRRTIEVNKPLCELLGYQAHEMHGKNPLEFVDEKNRQIFVQQMSQIESIKRREYEIELRHKQGQNIPTYFRANTLHTSSGEVLESVAFVTDLSEQKMAEKALRRAQKMDALGQLTGGIAHDFNNILSIILGNLSLLKNIVKHIDPAHKRVKTIEKSARRAADLTKQLLAFSRRQAAQVEVTNLNHVITEMHSLIAGSLTPRINLQQELSEKLWLTNIDPGDFEDALLNLIFNARDAMTDGGNLTIETSNKVLDDCYCEINPGAVVGEYVQVVVSDSGQGITTEQQEHIFDPFYTTKPQGKGTGLGLPMVYGFVKRSGGYIKVYSEVGIGSSFRVYLPRTQKIIPTSDQKTEKDEPLPRGHEAILIVDDETDLLELAEEFLADLGYQVFCARNAHQALEVLNLEPNIQLLFSDVVMPGGINGFELAEKAQKLYPQIKVLMTSGFTGKVLANNGQARFVTKMLSKPYSQHELANRIRESLGQPKGLKAYPPEPSQPTPLTTAPLTTAPLTTAEYVDMLSSSGLKLGIEAVDEDHEKIFDLYRRCVAAKEDMSENKLREVLSELEEYIRWHFPREEAIMKTCAYPGYENHCQVHRMLIKQFDKIQTQLRQQNLSVSQLLTFINDWIVDHIKGMDSSFVEFCRDKPEQIAIALQEWETNHKD